MNNRFLLSFVACACIVGACVASAGEFNLPVLVVHRTVGGKSVGQCGTLPFSVVKTGKPESLRVSISDDTPGGSGDSMRASLWTAAITAAMLKNSTLDGVRITADFEGYVDGPSAGAMMCLAIMTALDGKEFPDDFAMTGTILPDGTVGLVGGVPEKLKAAAATKKIKRVCIPAFERMTFAADGGLVDLFSCGKELGIEVVPVESIEDAYAVLHRLPRKAETILPVRDVCALDAGTEEWLKAHFIVEHDQLIDAINNLEEDDVNALKASMPDWKYIDPGEAKRLFFEGDFIGAYDAIKKNRAAFAAHYQSLRSIASYEVDFYRAIGADFTQSIDDMPFSTVTNYIAGLRNTVAQYCETELGWNADPSGSEEENKEISADDLPSPPARTSDIMTQFGGIRDYVISEGTYRFMQLQTIDFGDLPEALKNNTASAATEYDYERKKLFFLMSHKYEKDAPNGFFRQLPIKNAGPEIGRVEKMFHTAWNVIDRQLEIVAVKDRAEQSGLYEHVVELDNRRRDLEYNVYLSEKNFLRFVSNYFAEGKNVARYPSFVQSMQLFCDVDAFVDASALYLTYGPDGDWYSFVNFAIRRARQTALKNMQECRNLGICHVGAVEAFRKAENNMASGTGGLIHGVLSEYWRASMRSKALIMAFRNGNGQSEGFFGYTNVVDVSVAVSSESIPAISSAAGGVMGGIVDRYVERTGKIEKLTTERYDEILASLGDGNADIACGVFEPNTNYTNVLFTTTGIDLTEVIVVYADSSVNSIADLARADISASETLFATNWPGLGGAHEVRDFTCAGSYLKLKGKKVSAAVMYKADAEALIKLTGNKLRILCESKVRTPLAVAVARNTPGAAKIVRDINSIISELRQSGELVDEWKKARNIEGWLFYESGFSMVWGDESTRNLEKGVKMFQKALDRGVILANIDLGCCYQDGIGTEKDLNKALQYFIEAHKAGFNLEKYFKPELYEFEK